MTSNTTCTVHDFNPGRYILSGDNAINKNKVEFYFKSISAPHIREALTKVKTIKDFDVDSISSYFLKLALPFIENSLACLFNYSVETSLFSDSWKVARVAPIYKDGERAEKSNYRPISVWPVILRLFEKYVLTSCTSV